MDKAEQLGLYIGSFFDELIRLGVRDVVVSPGSRSTPLAMVAHEAHNVSEQLFGFMLMLMSVVRAFLRWDLQRQVAVR